jgi:pimeloyl-ACP methyl ester carboxylesterase
MKGKVVLAAGVLTIALFLSAFGQSEEGIVGVWQGALKISGMEIRVVFKISKQPDGTLTATMDSPDQGAKDIPVEGVTFQDGHVSLEVKSAMGLYEGDLQQDGETLEGQWTQGGMSLPLVMKRTTEAPGIKRPQEPKPPYPYTEEEVTYENKKAGVKLAGTLTFLKSEQPLPAVILISGSGPEDRNETVFGHRPFLVLADYLTRQGIAVLRVDDRGVGGSTGDASHATSADFAEDVLAGVDYLKTRREINPKQIGLIGHSEGGVIAPMAAVQSPDIAFIVLMAGPGLSGEEILYLQAELINKAENTSEKLIKWNRSLQERMFLLLKQGQDSAVVDQKLRRMLREAWAELDDDERRTSGFTAETLESQALQIQSPWFRFFLTYDPKPTLRKVTCPVLAINGEKDLQVPPKENLRAIGEALKAGGNKRFTVKELPNLNHLFQTAQTGSPTEYAKIEETISPTALELIASWILEQTGRK